MNLEQQIASLMKIAGINDSFNLNEICHKYPETLSLHIVEIVISEEFQELVKFLRSVSTIQH